MFGPLMMLSSIMSTRNQNKNAYRQQLQIVGDTKSTYVNLKDSMKGSKQTVGLALTKNEMVSLRNEAKYVAKRANSNTAGASALYAYTNFMQQKMFTKGTIVAKGEAVIQEYGKSAEATYNRSRSGINQAESRKKGALEATLDAFVAFGQGAEQSAKLGMSVV